jgi:hypothetical protein
MLGKDLFEYAVIRVVPQVEREEFINVGIVLYCAKQKFLKSTIEVDEQKLSTFAPKLDIAEVCTFLNAYKNISESGPNSGAIGKLPIAERFRWLTATRSTVVQSSKVHPGICDNAAEMLERLHQQLVAN